MGFSFRKSIKLGKYAKINLSKSGPSLSFGPKGAKVNINKRGYRTTLGKGGFQYRKDRGWDTAHEQSGSYNTNVFNIRDIIPYPRIFKILAVLFGVFLVLTFINPLNIVLALILSIVLLFVAIFNKQIRARNNQCYAFKSYRKGDFYRCIDQCQRSLKYMEYESTRDLMKRAQEQLNK